MTWRSAEQSEKVLSQLEAIRRTLEDPATGLSALYVTVDQGRQKILETVAQGTLGLREENRELRRRQERMLADLADTRAGLEALSRHVAETSRTAPQPQAPEPPPPVSAAEPEAQAAPTETIAPTDGRQAQVESLEEVRIAHGRTALRPQTPHHETVTPPREDQRAHLDHLLSAAALASAKLICHRETWEFIAEQTSGRAHFRLPDQVQEAEDGRIETSLSGRSLLALLTAMWQVIREHETDTDPGKDRDLATWALAAAVYRRTTLALDRVTDLPEKENGPAVIVLDDRSTLTTP
ncbi:hypothetical protein [Allostreptomyces psammosilenae]|uniref:Uncharacterized protein n=1 Tax=Allostreptomyces psammosilenae TaxID=1892865 RepID=A0A852ZXZ3_9ACTN|nr:hypothetical protein [Allostreptomyces psammosilenae]NYI05594.1 hypothetical protein [Allostreptomyces psammosilenae]